MAYDKLPPTRHQWGNTDFGTASDILLYFKGPKDKAGTLYDYGVYGLVEKIFATTLKPGIAVGIVGDENAFGEVFRNTVEIVDGTKSIRSTYREYEAGFATNMLDRDIPANTVVMVTIKAGTGGSDTGQAIPFVDVVWDD